MCHKIVTPTKCKRKVTIWLHYLYVKKQATYLPNLDQPFKVLLGPNMKKNKPVY